jgi:hypothetical protein
MATLPGLQVGLGLDATQFNQGLRQAGQQMQQTAQQTQRFSGTVRQGLHWRGYRVPG